MAAKSVRILDASGTAAKVGVLEVHVGSGAFGTVSGLNSAAADVACRELGYEFGVPSMSPCSTYGAANLCGSSAVPVTMQDLVCSGGELSVKDCTWSEPSGATHKQDSILFCGSSSDGPVDGSLRLLSPDGAPSLSASGIVEIYLNNHWSQVCGMSLGRNRSCAEA